MQFKQLLLSTTFTLGIATPIFAQYQADEPAKGFYIKAGAEYAMPIMGTLGFKGTAQQGQFNIADSTNSKTSFGDGVWASLNVGYFFTPNFGIDIGAKLGLSNSGKVYTAGGYDISTYNANAIVTTTKAKQPILFNPSLAYHIPFNKFSITGKTGVVIPFNTNLKQSVVYNIPAQAATAELEIRNRFALGFSGSLGAAYHFSDRLSVALEANVIALTIDPKEKELMSYKKNGVELIEPGKGEKIIYEYDIKQPSYPKEVPQPISFSRVGAQLGLVYSF